MHMTYAYDIGLFLLRAALGTARRRAARLASLSKQEQTYATCIWNMHMSDARSVNYLFLAGAYLVFCWES